MRIECPQCQEFFDAESASIVGDQVSFACQHCSTSIHVKVQRPAADSNEAKPRAVTPSNEMKSCPKCARPVDNGGSACGSCGLATERFASFVADEGDTDQELGEAWQSLLQNWQSQEAHERFLRNVAAAGDYRGGAGRYRALAADAERASRAQDMLQRIQTMAAAALLSSKPKVVSEEEPFKRVVVLLMVLVLLAGAGGMYIMVWGKRHQQRREPAPRMDRPSGLKSSGWKAPRYQPLPPPAKSPPGENR